MTQIITKKLTHDLTPETLAETKRLANKLHISDVTDSTTHTFFTIDTQARTHHYPLPKIHKQDTPGRPKLQAVEDRLSSSLKMLTTSSKHS